MANGILSVTGKDTWAAAFQAPRILPFPCFSKHTWITTCLPTKIMVKGKDETNECKYEQLLITAVWFSGSQAEWEWGKVESSQLQKDRKRNRNGGGMSFLLFLDMMQHKVQNLLPPCCERCLYWQGFKLVFPVHQLNQ